MDARLEKGKGPMIGKLRTATSIEGDLQINMRSYLNSDKGELIEGDDRFSASNYGSRKYHSIETVTLEKRLVMNNNLIKIKPTIHNIADLQACCDRQFLK